MWKTTLIALIAVSAIVTANVASADKRAVIRFADLGGIRDWRADGGDAIFVEGRNRKWYRGTFFGSCHGLRFAEAIAFITEADGSLDKFSSVWVDGQRCHFKSFYRVSGPDSEELYEVEESEPKS